MTARPVIGYISNVALSIFILCEQMCKLNENDQQAWNAVAAGVTPLPKKRVPNTGIYMPNQRIVGGGLSQITLKHNMSVTPTDKRRPIIAGATGENAPDGGIAKQMRAGKFRPRNFYDFHGHPAQVGFNRFVDLIKSHHAQGKRSILCITGKSGQMNKEFTNWCRHPSLNHAILYACPAHPKDGGSGAWYVILRKQRS
jgi:DNA-nicking Smr family endonuclease